MDNNKINYNGKPNFRNENNNSVTEVVEKSASKGICESTTSFVKSPLGKGLIVTAAVAMTTFAGYKIYGFFKNRKNKPGADSPENPSGEEKE